VIKVSKSQLEDVNVDDFTGCFGLAPGWSVAGLAVQQILGLLPQRRCGARGGSAARPALGWPTLRQVLSLLFRSQPNSEGR
jgi:hypothetical protein